MEKLGNLLAIKHVNEAYIYLEMKRKPYTNDDIMERAKETGKFCDIEECHWKKARSILLG